MHLSGTQYSFFFFKKYKSNRPTTEYINLYLSLTTVCLMIIYLNHLLFYSSTLQLIVLLVRYTWSICFRFISIDAINNQKSFILHFFALFGFDFPFFSALNLLHPHIKTKSNACHQKTFHIVSLLKFIAVPAKSFNIFQFQCKFMLKNGDEKNSILCYPSKGSPI